MSSSAPVWPTYGEKLRYAIHERRDAFLPSLLGIAGVLSDGALLRGMAVWAYYTVQLPKPVRVSRRRRLLGLAVIVVWIIGTATLSYFRR